MKNVWQIPDFFIPSGRTNPATEHAPGYGHLTGTASTPLRFYLQSGPRQNLE